MLTQIYTNFSLPSSFNLPLSTAFFHLLQVFIHYPPLCYLCLLLPFSGVVCLNPLHHTLQKSSWLSCLPWLRVESFQLPSSLGYLVSSMGSSISGLCHYLQSLELPNLWLYCCCFLVQVAPSGCWTPLCVCIQLLWWLSGKESTCQGRRLSFDPQFREMPWSTKWQPTPVLLPGKSHGQRNLVGYSPQCCRRVGHDLVTKQQHKLRI